MTAPTLLAAGPFSTYPTTASVSYQMPFGMAQGNITTTAGLTSRLNLVNAAGTIAKLYVTLSATNGRTTDTTFTLYKNGVSTALSVTIHGGAAAGIYTDLAHSVSVSAGDDIGIQMDVGTGAGVITVNSITGTFTPSAGTVQIFASSNAAGNANAAANTRFSTISGVSVFATTEPGTQTYMAVPGTFTGLNCYLSANSWSGTITVRLRKNAGNVNGIISIPASTSGLLQDISGASDTVAAGDNMSVQIVTGAGAGSLTYNGAGATFAAANDTESNIALNNPINVTTASPNSSIIGRLRFTGIESTTQSAFGLAGTIDRASIEVSSMGSTVDANLRLRNGGITQNMNVVITASTTGTYQDLVSTDAIAAGDLVNLQMQNANGTIIVRNFSARFTTAAIGGGGGGGATPANSNLLLMGA